MPSTEQQIIEAITQKISGTDPKRWYIGIATIVKKKLFEQHRVDEQNGTWLYSTAINNTKAKAIKQHFVDLGLDHKVDDDDINGLKVFVFLKK